MSLLKYVGLYPEIPGGTELDFTALKEEVKQYVTNILYKHAQTLSYFFAFFLCIQVALYKGICQMDSNKLCFCVSMIWWHRTLFI